MLNNKVIAIIASGMIVLTGCTNQTTNETKTVTTENTNEIVVNNQDSEKFKDRDILTYELLETNREGEHLNIKIKITNNGDKPINECVIYFNLYDADGNKLCDYATSEDTVLQPSKSTNKELWISELDAKDIQMTNYHYNVPNEKVRVDINKELKTVDITDLN